MRKARRALLIGLVTVGTLLGSALPARAASGDLDTSFSGDGMYVGESAYGQNGFVDANDKIVTCDGSLLYRYNTDGGLDTSFGGGDGTVNINGVTAFGCAEQSDGKIIVGGTSGNDFAATRYATNGDLDTSFGSNGVATWSVTTNDTMCPYRCVRVDSQDHVLVAGLGDGWWKITRLTSSGGADSSFGTNGKFKFTVSGDATQGPHTLAIQANNGRPILAGYDINSGVFYQAIARVTTGGALDTSFSSDGYDVHTMPNSSANFTAATQQSDGKIVACGNGVNPNNSTDSVYACTRYSSAGAIDTGFGTSGDLYVNPTPSSNSWDFITDVYAGTLKMVLVGSAGSANSQVFSLVCLNVSDGSVNTGFGSSGYVSTDLGTSTQHEEIEWVSPQGTSNGTRLLGVGNVYDTSNGATLVGIARYVP